MSFEVEASLTNGAIKSIKVDPDFKTIIIAVETSGTEVGELRINLPRNLIDAKSGTSDVDFIVVVGNTEVEGEEITKSDTLRELKISVPSGIKSIEIVGTSIVPEFPTSILFMVAIIMGIFIVLRSMIVKKPLSF